MKIEINIPDSVIEKLNNLGIKESDHEDVIVDFVNDKLDLHYHNGLTELFSKWALKKDNIETYLNKK